MESMDKCNGAMDKLCTAYGQANLPTSCTHLDHSPITLALIHSSHTATNTETKHFIDALQPIFLRLQLTSSMHDNRLV